MLEELTLNNFKAFAHLRLALAPLTLLSGLNGVGKSTALQALALLRQSADAGALAREGFLLNGELVSLGTGEDVLCEDYHLSQGRVQISIGVTPFGQPERLWTVDYSKEADLLRLSRKESSQLVAEVDLALFGRDFQYLRADRIVPAVSYPKSYDAAVRRGFLGSSGEHSVNYLRLHRDEKISHNSLLRMDARSDRLLDQVEAWMHEFCPGVNLAVQDLEGTDTVRLSYGFFGTAGIAATNRYRPTNVGFGLTYVLPVILACLTAKPGALLLIENPEAHLHPRGQSQMGRLVALAAATGAQVLVESHSDHLLNGMRLAVKNQDLSPEHLGLHYFHRAAQGEVKVAHPAVSSDGMLSDWPPGFFDEWDQALYQLLA